MSTPHQVAITGATGYMGRSVTQLLLERGHSVRALVRPGTRTRVVTGAEARELDLFDVEQLAAALQGCETVLQMVGTAHPNPSKAQEFRRVDLASAQACIAAAERTRPAHFIYVSVAQPAPVMHAYIATRAEAERTLRNSGLAATVLRPWYVLGPGHRWPVILIPVYAVAGLLPGMREGARRLGLVSLAQMTGALVHAVENPPRPGSSHIVDVPGIRASGAAAIRTPRPAIRS